MSRRLIPNIEPDQRIVSVDVNTTVRHAAQLMADHGLGAVLVIDHQRLVAIFSERDIVVKVLALGLDPDTVRVSDVARPHHQGIHADATPREALRVMHKDGLRYLPIMGDDGAIVAIVSIQDLYRVIMKNLEDDLLEMAHHMLGG